MLYYIILHYIILYYIILNTEPASQEFLEHQLCWQSFPNFLETPRSPRMLEASQGGHLGCVCVVRI